MTAVLTYDCGCSGPAFHDDYANVYIRPGKDNKCTKHNYLELMRVYECGCFVKPDSCRKEMPIRYITHHTLQSASDMPFTADVRLHGGACGCVGKPIGKVFSEKMLLYFIPAAAVCPTHKSLPGAAGAIVLAACGCALIDTSDPAYCDKHVPGSPAVYTDPFMKPSDKPVVITKK